MIDEKKIEEAAEKQIETIQPYSVEERLDRKEPISLYEKKDVLAMFRAGINWFKENFWSIADEDEPKASPKDENGFIKEEDTIWLLAITKDDEFKIMYSTHEKEYEGDTESYWLFHDKEGNEYNPFFGEVKKWLYIEDLMKGGK